MDSYFFNNKLTKYYSKINIRLYTKSSVDMWRLVNGKIT